MRTSIYMYSGLVLFVCILSEPVVLFSGELPEIGELRRLAASIAERESFVDAVEIEFVWESWSTVAVELAELSVCPASVPHATGMGRLVILHPGRNEQLVRILSRSAPAGNEHVWWHKGILYTYNNMSTLDGAPSTLKIEAESFHAALGPWVLMFLRTTPLAQFAAGSLSQALLGEGARLLGRDGDGRLRVRMPTLVTGDLPPENYDFFFHMDNARLERVELYVEGVRWHFDRVSRWFENENKAHWPEEVVLVTKFPWNDHCSMHRFVMRALKFNHEVDTTALELKVPQGTRVEDSITKDIYYVRE